VPGSHKWDKNRQPLQDEIAYAEMKAGSVFIYTGSVLHGGGTNNTNSSRLGVFLHYAPGWLRQEENQYYHVHQRWLKILVLNFALLLAIQKEVMFWASSLTRR
jgi:ectoine hydroxylase-related dioxygenase (phytanoyl-CoA dioxygenase family)